MYRALGNRSLLAAPFHGDITKRLNAIKQREWYRPIAPVCLEEDSAFLFGLEHPSPYMLHFQQCAAPELRAVIHFDGSSRVQTVNIEQNPLLHRLLVLFRSRSGFGVLCNTSLNQRGRGFINRSSDLFAFAQRRAIDTVVVGDSLYRIEFVDPARELESNTEGGMMGPAIESDGRTARDAALLLRDLEDLAGSQACADLPGRAGNARVQALSLLNSGEFSASAVAALALAEGLLNNDTRVRQLIDYDRFVASGMVSIPQGFSESQFNSTWRKN